MEYKTDDVVLVRAKITDTDPDCAEYDDLLYEIKVGVIEDLWVRAEDVVALVEREEVIVEQKVEEPEVKLKFKVGDKVIHRFRPDWNVGVIKEVDDSAECTDYYNFDAKTSSRRGTTPYKIRFPDWNYCGTPHPDTWWTAEENIILVKEN
jgi:hypothetical protein